MSDPNKRISSHQTVRNETAGATSGTVLQTGSVHGDIHLHAPDRPDPFRHATRVLAACALALAMGAWGLALAAGVWSAPAGKPLTFVMGVLALGIAGLLVTGRVLWKRTHAPLLPRAALDRLRTQVRTQWRDEASHRGLHRPRPLRLRWRPTSEAVERAYSGIERPDTEFMHGELTPTIGDLSSAGALASAFQEMSRRQLVVLGPPGAGKSTLAVLFTLAVLDKATNETPVPVLLSVAAWDPSERIEDWCARRVAEDYPVFGPNRAVNQSRAAVLLQNSHIVPVLDGLDEMPRPVLSTALADLDRAAENGLRMVLTCRSAEFAQAVQDHGALVHAAVVDIEPVQVEDTIAYLTEPEVANTRRWSTVTELLRKEPSGPLARALSTPLMISLARSVYRPSNSRPGELTRFTTAPEITDHLLKNYLSTIFPNGEHEKARRWLSFLSHHLQEQNLGPNFEWWHLARSVPRWLLFLLIAVASTMCGSILFALYLAPFSLKYPLPYNIIYLYLGVFFGTICGATAGAVVGFLGGARTVRSLQEPKQRSPRRILLSELRNKFRETIIIITILFILGTLVPLTDLMSDQRMPGDLATNISGTPGKLTKFNNEALLHAVATVFLLCQVALVINFLSLRPGPLGHSTLHARNLLPSLAAGLALGLTAVALELALGLLNGSFFIETPTMLYFFFITLLIGMPMGIVRWLTAPDKEQPPSSPLSALRGARTTILTAAFLGGGITALGVAGALTYSVGLAGFTITIWIFSGLVGIVIMMAVVVGTGSAWLSYTVARLWLAFRGRIPWHLMRFLKTAHEKGVLRQAGPAYQIRHELLRTHLAKEWKRERISSPTRRFISRCISVH